MYQLVSKLVLYRDLGKNSILYRLSQIFADYEAGNAEPAALVTRIYEQIKALLDLATQFGFDQNLWHNYLTFLLLTSENSFTLTCEKVGASDGSVNHFAKGDFKIFKELFDFDFSPVEHTLGIDCFTTICNYHAIPKRERMYNKNVGERVQSVSLQIDRAKDEEDIFNIVTEHYRIHGVGMFGFNRAFRIQETRRRVEFLPINNTDAIMLHDLVGYEYQKQRLVENTKAFIEGKAANNVLLYGDAGTGKSSSIKAILNEFYLDGLRLIELYKHQFRELSNIISQLKNRNYRFIIYMDDLSFEETETEYKYLKAVIEGGLETRPDNVLIYATSNRRHLIREVWDDRSDMSDYEVNRSDTMQEKLSLVARFGITINYSRPSQKEYFAIVDTLAKKYPNINLSEEELHRQAVQWELSHGGFSGRAAQQFIDYLAGTGEQG